MEKGILHGVREPETLFRNIAKAVFVVSGETDLIDTLEASFRTAASARRGPVVVFIPYRLLEKEVASPGRRPRLRRRRNLTRRPLKKRWKAAGGRSL